MLSEHYFGDLEAFDEANHHHDFFEKTFVVPSSLSPSTLRNDRKFIIVGRKGVGKTAIQMKMAQDFGNKGYLAHQFRFVDDLRSDDYAEISKTQSGISLTIAAEPNTLFLHYDFRDVWERIFLKRLAETLVANGHSNSFVGFTHDESSKFHSIFHGITKNLKIKVSGSWGPILAEIGFNDNEEEMPLKTYNKIARELFAKHCKDLKMYFFIDELVFSRLGASEDEVKLRAAMVRDIIRTTWELNQFCAKNKMDIHFICSVRPEIRNLINDYDSEAGKLLDGKDVELTWVTSDGDKGKLISEVFRSKVCHSRHPEPKFQSFVTQHISFSGYKQTLEEFLLTNTWARPRDVVRLLLSIAKKSPNATKIGENEIKASLSEYSRTSAKELIDELGVRYGDEILRALRKGIYQKVFDDRDAFADAIAGHLSAVDIDGIVDELYYLGFIGNYDPEKRHHYWAHRGNPRLLDNHKIRIHPALWNEFGLR